MTLPLVRIALAALTLGGCAGQGLLGGETAAPAAGLEAGMAGRWMLAAPNAPMCGMNFTGAPGAQQGGVVPEGGCPERFFLSRRWALDQGALTVNDGEANALSRFTFTEGRFTGQTTTGTPVTLTRQQPQVSRQ